MCYNVYYDLEPKEFATKSFTGNGFRIIYLKRIVEAHWGGYVLRKN
jgi:hypothetical protein